MAFLIRDTVVNDFLENIAKDLDNKKIKKNNKKIDAVRFLCEKYRENK